MTKYQQQRAWSDAHITAVADNLTAMYNVVPATKIIGEIRPADFKRDALEASDLYSTTLQNELGELRIGMRLRTVDNLGIGNRRNEFTIRWSTINGKTSEYHKIMSGWMKHFYYGFADGGTIYKSVLLDMDIFRRIMLSWTSPWPDKPADMPGTGPIPNSDGTKFLAFNLDEFSTTVLAKTA